MESLPQKCVYWLQKVSGSDSYILNIQYNSNVMKIIRIVSFIIWYRKKKTFLLEKTDYQYFWLCWPCALKMTTENM